MQNVFKSPSTVHHENHDFSENKKVLQHKNPLKTIPNILIFYAFRFNNTPTVPHQKNLKLFTKYDFLCKCTWKSLSGYLASSQKIVMRSIPRWVCVLWRVTVERYAIRCVDCALCFVWWKDVVIQSARLRLGGGGGGGGGAAGPLMRTQPCGVLGTGFEPDPCRLCESW